MVLRWIFHLRGSLSGVCDELAVNGIMVSIITDLLMGYENAVKEIFPNCYYNQCVLYAEGDTKRIVKENLTGEVDKKYKKKLIKDIWNLFASREGREVKNSIVRY